MLMPLMIFMALLYLVHK